MFFGPNFPKNGFWGQKFENLTPDSNSALPRYHLCQFSGKTDYFDFSPNLPKSGFRVRKLRKLMPE